MKPVKITINSKTNVKDEKNKDVQEKFQFSAQGILREKAGTYYVFYEESAVTGMEGTTTTLKWNQDSVTLLRHGTYEHRQEYTLGRTIASTYKTPYITIPMAVTTQGLFVENKGNRWHIDIKYYMEVCGEPHGNVELAIDIEEDA